MKTKLLPCVILWIATQMAGFSICTASEDPFAVARTLTAVDGREAVFFVVEPVRDGLWVRRGKDAAPVLLAWGQLDLAVLADRHPDLHMAFSGRAELPIRSAWAEPASTAPKRPLVPANAVSVRAREDTEVARKHASFTTDYGSFIRDHWGSRSLKVELRRQAGEKEIGVCEVEVLFYSGLSPNYRLVDRQRHKMELPLSDTVIFYPLCGYRNTVTNLQLIGVYDFEGTPKPTSWAVRVWHGETPLGSVASMPELRAWLEKYPSGSRD